MLLLIITSLIVHSNANLNHYLRDIENNSVKSPNENDRILNSNDGDSGYIIGDPLWVLHLNKDGWMDPKLVLGSLADQEDFYYAVAPMIRRASNREIGTKVVKNDESLKQATNKPSNEDLKSEVVKLINKFALSINEEPDSYLTDNIDKNGPSLALYFKGPISCLIVILGDKQWHYILQGRIFPAWFYEAHDTFEAPLKIPEEFQSDFFSMLLLILKRMVYHPL